MSKSRDRKRITVTLAMTLFVPFAAIRAASAGVVSFNAGSCVSYGSTEDPNNSGLFRFVNGIQNSSSGVRTIVCPIPITVLSSPPVMMPSVVARRANTSSVNPMACSIFEMDMFGNVTYFSGGINTVTQAGTSTIQFSAAPETTNGSAALFCTFAPSDIFFGIRTPE
jgi:hypothetical protein